MKTIVFLGSILLLFALSSTAQISINRSDIGNLVGAIVIQANDTTNLGALSPGSAGTNCIWNLTGMSNNFQDTMIFSSPADKPCYEDFPTATLALLDSGNYIYLIDNNIVLSIMGVCGTIISSDTISVPYTPPQKHITFPSTYNTSFSGQSKATIQISSSSPPPDSLRLVITSDYTSLIDGWGTITTPTGTYTALRQKLTIFETDSSYVYISGIGWVSGGTPSLDTTISYNWWSKTNPFIANITTDGNGNVLKANYLLFSNLDVHEQNHIQNDISVFPNPSNGIFTISTENGIINAIEIYNVVGEKILYKEVIKKQLYETIDLSNRPKGIYIIKLIDGKTSYSKMLVIQ